MRRFIYLLLALLFQLQHFLAVSQDKFHTFPISESVQTNQATIDLISNGDFQKYDSLCEATHSSAQPCPDPFNNGCIDSWHASHGSPEFSVQDHAARIGAVKSNGYQWGEGIYQTLRHPVDSGKSYMLLFDCQSAEHLNNANSSLTIQLTKEEFDPGTCFEMLPAPGTQIFGSPFQVSLAQKSFIVCFIAPGNFNKIWLDHINESDSVGWIKIRNVHLFKLEDISPLFMLNILNNNGSYWFEGCVPQFFLSERNLSRQSNLLITNPVPLNDSSDNFPGDYFQTIEITNLNGDLVHRYSKSSFDISLLRKGNYIMKIFSNQSLSDEKKIMILKE